jgi:crotonobetainyl-CoA:carnitine CoA-transferase CaiB-like acyl-CoA transferase
LSRSIGERAQVRADQVNAPLAGVRVLDLTQVVAGPYCTMMLADMGAEVVKIERPGHGDDLRRTVPYRGREGHEDYFYALNRSKKSVALDLKVDSHRALGLRLAERADVLVENFAPGTAARLGFGWDDVKARNSRLVYCSLSGFGQTGPYRDRLALDPIIQAVTGAMSVTG